MTLEQRIVMQQALEALQKWNARGRLRIIDALRAELAKAEQELPLVTDAKELPADQGVRAKVWYNPASWCNRGSV
jgi:transcription initiation factor TFIIIB Brf1 subunit/transcription initiation factor TFIIB